MEPIPRLYGICGKDAEISGFPETHVQETSLRSLPVTHQKIKVPVFVPVVREHLHPDTDRTAGYQDPALLKGRQAFIGPALPAEEQDRTIPAGHQQIDHAIGIPVHRVGMGISKRSFE